MTWLLAAILGGVIVGFGAAHDYNSCRDNLINILNKSDAFILDRAARFSQGALQTELNAFLATATEGVAEGHTGQQAIQQAWYLAVASLPCVRNVCEIGFNAGHSSTVWMTARPDIHLHSFDMGAKDFSFPVAKFMSDKFPGRITFTWGNSLETVPARMTELRDKCDIVVVDGGHDTATAWQDTVNMRELANPEFAIFIIDDVNCIADYCRGPEEAVAHGVREGMLEMLLKRAATWEGMVVGEESMGVAMRGFSLGSYINKRSVGARAQMQSVSNAGHMEGIARRAEGAEGGSGVSEGGLEQGGQGAVGPKGAAGESLQVEQGAQLQQQQQQQQQQEHQQQGQQQDADQQQQQQQQQQQAQQEEQQQGQEQKEGADAGEGQGESLPSEDQRAPWMVPKSASFATAAEAGAAAAAAAGSMDSGGWWVAAALSLMALVAYVYWPRASQQLMPPRPPVLPTHSHIHD